MRGWATKKIEHTPSTSLTALPVPLTRHTNTPGWYVAFRDGSVSVTFFSVFIFCLKMVKKNKKNALEAKPGDKPRSSKHKVNQQSAPLASAISLPEKAKKPKAVVAEATPLSPPPTPAEVAKGTSSAANVVEDDGNDNDKDENSDDASDYAPDEVGSEGTINLADDALTAGNLQDKVKPGLKVSNPFDLPILPVAKTLLVEKDKKGKKVNDDDEESIIMLSDEESPLKKNKGKLVTKLPAEVSLFHLCICFCKCLCNCFCKLFSKCFCICCQC